MCFGGEILCRGDKCANYPDIMDLLRGAGGRRVEVVAGKTLVKNSFYDLKITLIRVSLQLFIDSIQVKYLYVNQLKICHQHRMSKGRVSLITT